MAKAKHEPLYNLSRMPFELGRYDSPRVGRAHEWTRLQEIVESGRQSRSPVFGVLLGTYGSGKSFLLWHLSREFRKRKRPSVFSIDPIRLIDPEQKRDFVRSLVIRMFRRGIDIEGQLAVVARTARLPDVIPFAARRFMPLLLATANPKVAAAAVRVLHGGRALRSEANAGGFLEAMQVKSNEDAIELLFSLQVLVHAGGYEVLALLVDETEYIDNLPVGQRVAVLDSLKNLWDQEVGFFLGGTEAAQLVMVLSATPAFWQERSALVRSASASGKLVGVVPFLDRIPDLNVVEMPPELERDEARKLISTRMNEVREGSEGRPQRDIIPFTDDYVDYVYDLSRGRPRKMIEICATVIVEADNRGLPKIDAQSARRILRELLIPSEPDGDNAHD